MSTIKSRTGYLYWNGAYVPELVSVTISMDREYLEDTSWGDNNRTYQTGFPDFRMSVERHYDLGGFFGLESDAIAQDPTPRGFYFYPHSATTTDYWYGASMYAGVSNQGGGLGDISNETYEIRAGGPVYHRTA